MRDHERMLRDPMGTLRGAWDDTGWRFALIAAALIFVLETVVELVGMEQGTAWWAAQMLTIVVVARSLARRPVRGTLTDTENLTVVLAVVGLLMAEGVLAYTTVSDSFAAQPIFWPFSVTLMLTVIAARIAAPYVMRPLNAWLIIYAFLSFWLHLTMWTSELSFVDPPFTWALALTSLALIARWIAGRGFAGPMQSPLNVTLGIYVYLLWWLEYGINESGIGADPWGNQELYWPWILATLGLALGVRIVAPPIAARVRGD